jgi:hypothetical protein
MITGARPAKKSGALGLNPARAAGIDEAADSACERLVKVAREPVKHQVFQPVTSIFLTRLIE